MVQLWNVIKEMKRVVSSVDSILSIVASVSWVLAFLFNILLERKLNSVKKTTWTGTK